MASEGIERLRATLDKRGISQGGLARLMLGPKATDKQIRNRRGQITRWLGGKNEPSRRSWLEIARALGEPPEVYFTQEPPPRLPVSDAAELAKLRRDFDAFAEGVTRRLGDLESARPKRARR